MPASSTIQEKQRMASEGAELSMREINMLAGVAKGMVNPHNLRNKNLVKLLKRGDARLFIPVSTAWGDRNAYEDPSVEVTSKGKKDLEAAIMEARRRKSDGSYQSI